MDELELRLDFIKGLKGLGEGTLLRIVDSLGGEGPLLEALERGDVERISSVDRISGSMAVRMILAYRGEEDNDLLGTPGSRDIHRAIQSMAEEYVHTGSALNRIRLLVPRRDMERNRASAVEIHSFASLIEGRDREYVESLLSHLSKGRAPSQKRGGLPYFLLAEDITCQKGLESMGLDRRCMVLSPEDLAGSTDEDIVYVYSRRELDESLIPAVASVSINSPPEEIVPDIVLERYGGIESRLKPLSLLEREFERTGVADKAMRSLEELKSLQGRPRDPDDVREGVHSIMKELNESLKAAISDLTFSGEDTLTILVREDPDVLRSIYKGHAAKAADMVRERLGVSRDLFRMRYPIQVDEEALESLVNAIRIEEGERRFERKAALARDLVAVWDPLQVELAWANDLDYRWGLGCLVHDLRLSPFRPVEGWFGMREASHLSLRGKEGTQPVTYHLGPVPADRSLVFPSAAVSPSKTTMLTGANSGGKTTLLETVAQVLVMAHMGLPVPAEEAYVPEVGGLHIYRPRKHMDAGGLEVFLRDILPLSLKADEGSFILADELEAMTELEAASRIIGGFLNELEDRGAFSIVVTHMVEEILRFTGVRVDGIEARGLDDKMDLIVDRTPRIGHHARSMPELILRRMQARSSDEESKLYGRILGYFEGGGDTRR